MTIFCFPKVFGWLRPGRPNGTRVNCHRDHDFWQWPGILWRFVNILQNDSDSFYIFICISTCFSFYYFCFDFPPPPRHMPELLPHQIHKVECSNCFPVFSLFCYLKHTPKWSKHARALANQLVSLCETVNDLQVRSECSTQDFLVFPSCSLQHSAQPSSSVCVSAGWRGGNGEEGPQGWGGGELGPWDASTSRVGWQSVFQLWG